MATIYFVDNELESIQIKKTDNSIAIPVARGMLFVKDTKHTKLNEYWLSEENGEWLQYEGFNKYCLVVND